MNRVIEFPVHLISETHGRPLVHKICDIVIFPGVRIERRETPKPTFKKDGFQPKQKLTAPQDTVLKQTTPRRRSTRAAKTSNKRGKND